MFKIPAVKGRSWVLIKALVRRALGTFLSARDRKTLAVNHFSICITRQIFILRRGAVFLLLLLIPLHATAELDRLATVYFYTPASKEDQPVKQIEFQKKSKPATAPK